MVQVSASLRERLLALYESHISAGGRSVDYGAIGRDPDFSLFVAAAGV